MTRTTLSALVAAVTVLFALLLALSVVGPFSFEDGLFVTVLLTMFLSIPVTLAYYCLFLLLNIVRLPAGLTVPLAVVAPAALATGAMGFDVMLLTCSALGGLAGGMVLVWSRPKPNKNG